MEQLVIQIIGGLAVVAIAAWLGIGRSSVRIIHSTRPSKTWKRVILISWLMIIAGIYMFGSNKGTFINITANNIYAIIGLDLIGFGIIALIIGKVGHWFNKD